MSDDKLVMGFRAEVYMSENVDSLTHVTAEDFIMADEFEAAGTLPLTSGRDLRFTQGRVDRAMPDFAHSLRPEAPERMMNPSSDAQIAAAPLQPVGVPVIRTIAMPTDTNPFGSVFGGWLMAQMDLAAGSAATRRARGPCAATAVNDMVFLAPVRVGDEVSLYARTVAVGRASMQILVEIWRRPSHAFDSVQATKATFTYVAINEAGRPRRMPLEGELA